MTTSDAINDIAHALSKAQGKMRPAVKDATNPHFKSRYADLAANVEAARGPMAENGLSVIQEATTTERGIAVATRLLHASGQWIQFEPLTVPLAKQDAHGVGSALTYARRYALGAVLGLVADDDDGNAATSQPPAQAVKQRPQPLPAGFGELWADLQAVADEGPDALKAAWSGLSADVRGYIATNLKDKWEATKAKAQKAAGVTA